MEKIKNYIFANRIRTLIAVIALIIVGFLGWQNFGAKKQQTQQQTAKVEKGTLVLSLTESGQVAVTNRISITTLASGVINEVDVKNGDTVTAGQKITVVSLDQAGQQRQAQAWSSYLSAQNTVSAAQAKINSLQSALFTANRKFVNGAGTQNPITDDPNYIIQRADWLQSEADYKNQQNVIAQAQVSLTSAWLSYQAAFATITAPVGGTMNDLIITPGLQIGSSGSTTTSSQVIGTVRTAGNPLVSVSLSEIDATKVKAGQKVTLTFDALPNKTFTGKVLGINTTGIVTSGVTTYPASVQLDLPNDTILPNMSVSANIIIGVKNDVLLVSSGAIQTTGGQTSVRLLKNGTIVNIPVEVGDSSDTQTEVISGLSEGDNVIIGTVATQQSATPTGSSPFSARFGGFGGGGARGSGR